MTKVIRKSNKSSQKRANKKTLKRAIKNKKNNSRSKVMRGGDDGRYVLPPSYFGGKQNGYVSKFENLAGAVSQGTVTANGKYAGPNLYPSMGLVGGGCGCSGKKRKSQKSKSQHKSNNKQKKSRKSKSKNNKIH
jgi:hypothetical protein